MTFQRCFRITVECVIIIYPAQELHFWLPSIPHLVYPAHPSQQTPFTSPSMFSMHVHSYSITSAIYLRLHLFSDDPRQAGNPDAHAMQALSMVTLCYSSILTPHSTYDDIPVAACISSQSAEPFLGRSADAHAAAESFCVTNNVSRCLLGFLHVLRCCGHVIWQVNLSHKNRCLLLARLWCSRNIKSCG